ncbi:MAG: HdeD family acid-resistance protein [Methyloceanibacter sp.]
MATGVHAHQRDIWWVFLLEGIAAIIFGILLLTHPAATLVTFAIFLGFYLLFIGVLELVRIFVDRSVPWYWSLLIGVLGIVAGIVVLRHPVLTAIAIPTAVVVWLGVLALIMGAVGIIGGFSGGGFGSFILGVVSLIIGILLLGSPLTTAFAVPFVFGIILLIEGVLLIIYAFRVKS